MDAIDNCFKTDDEGQSDSIIWHYTATQYRPLIVT